MFLTVRTADEKKDRRRSEIRKMSWKNWWELLPREILSERTRKEGTRGGDEERTVTNSFLFKVAVPKLLFLLWGVRSDLWAPRHVISQKSASWSYPQWKEGASGSGSGSGSGSEHKTSQRIIKHKNHSCVLMVTSALLADCWCRTEGLWVLHHERSRRQIHSVTHDVFNQNSAEKFWELINNKSFPWFDNWMLLKRKNKAKWGIRKGRMGGQGREVSSPVTLTFLIRYSFHVVPPSLIVMDGWSKLRHEWRTGGEIRDGGRGEDMLSWWGETRRSFIHQRQSAVPSSFFVPSNLSSEI